MQTYSVDRQNKRVIWAKVMFVTEGKEVIIRISNTTSFETRKTILTKVGMKLGKGEKKYIYLDGKDVFSWRILRSSFQLEEESVNGERLALNKRFLNMVWLLYLVIVYYVLVEIKTTNTCQCAK